MIIKVPVNKSKILASDEYYFFSMKKKITNMMITYLII